MAFCAIRCSHPFARDSHEVGIQLAIGILVVKHRYGIRARCNSGKFADCLVLRDSGMAVCNGFLALLWKAIGRRIERAEDFSLVTVQSANFHMDDVCRARLRLRHRELNQAKQKSKKAEQLQVASHHRSPALVGFLQAAFSFWKRS